MADSRSFDAILGVSKKIIHRGAEVDENNQSDYAKERISSAITRLKEKSQELSDRKLDELSVDCKIDETGISQLNEAVEVEDASEYTVEEAVECEIEDDQDQLSPSNACISSDSSISATKDTGDHFKSDKDWEMESDELVIEEESVKDANSNDFNKNDILVEYLQNEIHFLKQQIEVKDRQLDKKDELILNFQVLLKSEQDKVLRLESKMTEEKESNVDEPKGWLVKLFGKRIR